MFGLITFPWPVPSANVPLVAIGSRSLPQRQQPTPPPVTADSLTSLGQDEPASTTGERRTLLAPKV